MTQTTSHETIRNRIDSSASNTAGTQNAATNAGPQSTASAPRPREAAPVPAEPRDSRRTRAKATAQVFLGGASYGAMATSYKLSYAAGFTSSQVVAGQGWTSCFLFAILKSSSLPRLPGR